MRLQMILPRVEPTVITLPLVCPHDDCEGTHFQHHQEVSKAVRDTVYDKVRVHRYKCLRCGRTLRVYPSGGEPRSDLSAGGRVGGDVVPVGVELWSGFPGDGSAGGVYEQDQCV